MMGVRSHHTGGKTSSAKLPKITSPGVVTARPEHPLHVQTQQLSSPHTSSATNHTASQTSAVQTWCLMGRLLSFRVLMYNVQKRQGVRHEELFALHIGMLFGTSNCLLLLLNEANGAKKRHLKVFATRWDTRWWCFPHLQVWDERLDIFGLQVLHVAAWVPLLSEVTMARVQRKRCFTGRCDSWPCLSTHGALMSWLGHGETCCSATGFVYSPAGMDTISSLLNSSSVQL